MTSDLEEKKEREREFTREVRFNSEMRKLCRRKDKNRHNFRIID